jgi:serine phosphatase RsbU (regulator of sigma subunit)
MVATMSALAPYKPPVDAREHFLVLAEGWQPGLRVRIDSKPLRIGRSSSCDLVVPDSQVSGRHLELHARPNQPDATLTDLGSTNGSFIEGKRVQGTVKLRPGGMVRIGSQVFIHQYLLKSEVARTEEHGRDIEKARSYVQSLLPAPIRSGPVMTDWVFRPSTELGGDAFGYHQLSEHTFTGYLIDVSGHGVGAAMHSVSVMNVMRQRALPGTDFHEPAAVLRSLNEMFQMDSHNGMYFSMWYGVYDLRTRTLRYASAGHHPSYLANPQRTDITPLQTRNLMIGAMPGISFKDASCTIAPASVLYVFSDGVFEVATKDGRQWGLPDFLPLLSQPPAVDGEPARLYAAVQQVARAGPLDDDFSLLTVTFS